MSEPNVDLHDPRTDQSIPLTEVEKEWLLMIRPADFVFRRSNIIDIEVYAPSLFVVQIGFSKGVIEQPGYMQRPYGSLQDANNA